MKKLLCALCGLICSVAMSAQLQYVEGSFRSVGAADVEASGKDLGKKNMTENLAVYAPAHDDGDAPSAIIRVGFINMAAEDIDKHVVPTVTPGWVNRVEYKRNPVTKAMECWVHVDPGTLTLNITVDNIGSKRIPNLEVEGGRMYALEVRTDETIPVKLIPNVDNTTIWFDGEELPHKASQNNPVIKENVHMGTHHVKAVNGTRSRDFDIDVSKNSNTFNLDLLERYKINFQSNEAGVELYEDNKLLGTMPFELEVSEGPHSYIVHKSGYDDKEHNVNVSGAATFQLDIHKNRTIDFYALSNNTDYKGASVYVDNILKGKTPLTLTLPYGRHIVRMSAEGRDKSASITVGDDTPTRFMLKLPARHRSFNPFDIDFHKREYGFTVGYVQKWMHLSDGSQTMGVDYFGEERHMHGFQVGVPVQPIFGYGLGLNTGLYFEGYFSSWDDPEEYETINMTELCLYMPVDFMFRLPLGENFSFYVTGGIGIDWSLSTSLSADGYNDVNIDYGEDGAPNRFNFSAEFGGGLQYKAFQLSANYQFGLNNNSKFVSDSEEVTAKLRKLGIQISFMF